MRSFILAILACVLIYTPWVAYSYTEPPNIPFSKPQGGNTWVVGSGEDFEDLNQANGKVAGGDLILVRAGTYPVFEWTQSGQANKPIWIENYGDGNVVFTSSDRSYNNITGSYVVFDGGTNREITFRCTYADVSLRLLGEHVTIRRCKISDGGAFKTAQPAACLWLRGGYAKIYNNIISSESSNFTDEGIYFTYNYERNIQGVEIKNNIISTPGTGIQCNPHGGNSVTGVNFISGNFIHSGGYKPGNLRPAISILSNDNSWEAANLYIYNNIIFDYYRGIEFSATITGLTAHVYNNTVYRCDQYGIYIRSGSGGRFFVRNNLIVNSGTEELSMSSNGNTLTTSNQITIDPGFLSTNLSRQDLLRLKDNSDAIDAGYDVRNIVNIDYFGNERDQNLDIGAHEFGAQPAGIEDNDPPNGIIDLPTEDVSINVGQTITFAGSATDESNNSDMSYVWSFGAGSGVSISEMEDPGQIRFNNAGIFVVSLTATDESGLSDPTPATRTITVQQAQSDPIVSDPAEQGSNVNENITTVTPSSSYTVIESAQAGDIIEVVPGTYRYRVYLRNSGTEDQPIIIRAQDPNNRPVWDLSGDSTRNFPGSYTGGDRHRGIWQVTGNNIRIEGIVFKNGHDSSNCAGIRPKGAGNLTLKNCHFEGNDNGITGWGTVLFEKCTITANGDPGPGDLTHNIYSEGGNYTFRYCRIWDPLEGQNIHSRSLNMTLEYCIIENAASYMGDIMDYRLDGTSGLTFTQTLTMIGNLIVQKTAPANDGQVFVTYRDGSGTNTIDMRINMYYNTFVGIGDNAALIHFTNSGIRQQSAYLYNNIFYGNHRPFRIDVSSGFHAEARNNWWPSGFDYSAHQQYMSNSVFGSDPGFIDAAADQYSLAAGADARFKADRGIGAVAGFEPVIVGGALTYNYRSTADDLGAYEYGSLKAPLLQVVPQP